MSFAATAIGPWSWVGMGASLGVMATALISDVKYQRIPNSLTYPAAVAGILINWLALGTEGMISSFAGLALGFGILFVAMMFGGVAGGDVKLAACLGALVGLETTALGLLYMGLCAGAIALGIMIWKGKLLKSLRRMWRFLFTSLLPWMETESLDEANSDTFPLGVAIVAGFAWAMAEKFFGAESILGLG